MKLQHPGCCFERTGLAHRGALWPPSDLLGELAALRASDGSIPVLDAQVVEEVPQHFGPAPLLHRPRPEPVEEEEPPAKRAAIHVTRPAFKPIPQKARPRVKVRCASEVQEVRPESCT